MRLRGYGNSIVPQLAAAFVTAYNDVVTEAALSRDQKNPCVTRPPMSCEQEGAQDDPE